MRNVTRHAEDEAHQILVLDRASVLEELARHAIEGFVDVFLGTGAMPIPEEGREPTAKLQVALAGILAVRSEALDERIEMVSAK
jgi:hypothetical protein